MEWSAIQNSGSEGLTSEELVVCLGQTSKTADTLIIPAVATNNQHVPHLKGGANNRKLVINEVGPILVSVQVHAEAFLSITPMVVRALDFGGDSALRDHKKIVDECPLTGLHENFFSL